jgi:hypothetical protein
MGAADASTTSNFAKSAARALQVSRATPDGVATAN